MPRYPDCFPADIEKRILEDGGQRQQIQAYRVCVNGLINRDAYRSTLENNIANGNTRGLSRDEYLASLCNTDILDDCATSLSDSIEAMISYVNLGYKPNAIITQGITDPSCGYSMMTRNSNSGRGRKRPNHVDWWVFEDSNPHVFFTVVQIDSRDEL